VLPYLVGGGLYARGLQLNPYRCPIGQHHPTIRCADVAYPLGLAYLAANFVDALD
jgi:hypothetical protein